MGLAFRPSVKYAPGAEEQIGELFSSNKSVVLTSNHTRGVDPCIIAAIPTIETVFNPLIGNTFIPSKISIFKNPLVRRAVDGLGAVPVFRPKDIAEAVEANPGASPGLSRSALTAFVKTCVTKIEAGQNMAIFPEGTRNKNDPNKVQELQGGIGLMVCRVTKVPQPAVIPLGIYYGDRAGYGRAPSVFVGQPSSEPFQKPAELMEWLRPEMQTCVDAAIVNN